MLTPAELEQMKEVQMKDVEKNTLQDIEGLYIDPALSVTERLNAYLGQVKNPYLFRCGNTAIKLDYTSTENTIDDALSVYLSHLKNP